MLGKELQTLLLRLLRGLTVLREGVTDRGERVSRVEAADVVAVFDVPGGKLCFTEPGAVVRLLPDVDLVLLRLYCVGCSVAFRRNCRDLLLGLVFAGALPRRRRFCFLLPDFLADFCVK